MLTLMTYNLHSGKDAANQPNLPAMIETIRGAHPDIVALQEVACRTLPTGNVDMPKILRDELGMFQVFAPAIPHGGGDYGIALMTRLPVKNARIHHVPDVPEAERTRHFEHRVVIACDIEAEGGIITFLCTHMGLSEAERRNAVALMCRLIDENPYPVAVAGDLNTSPDEELIQPLFDRVKDHSSEFTFPEKNCTHKIDYILTSPHWQVEDEHPLLSEASDHRAVVKQCSIPAFLDTIR